MPILSAASPVEIEAQADALALPPPARAAALALFRGLTSREELASLTLPDGPAGSHDGGEWPAHRFLFGTAEEVGPLLRALRSQPDAAELAGGDAPEGLAPRTLFLAAEADGLTGVLLACSDAGRLAEIMADVVPPSTGSATTAASKS